MQRNVMQQPPPAFACFDHLRTKKQDTHHHPFHLTFDLRRLTPDLVSCARLRMVTVQCAHGQRYMCLNTNTGETNDRDRRVAKGQHLYHNALNSFKSTVRQRSQHQCCRSKKNLFTDPSLTLVSLSITTFCKRCVPASPLQRSRIQSPTSSITDTDATSQVPLRH